MSDRPLDPFSAACGAVGPLLFEVEDPGGEIRPRRAFDQTFLVVGSGESADLAIVDETISPRHCYLQLIEGRLFGVDLDGRQRTRFGGQPGPMGWVQPGETIGIGRIELRFLGGGAAHADSGAEEAPCPISERPEEPERLPGAALEIAAQGLETLTCRLSRVLTLVGTASVCKVRLRDPRISRYHLALLKTPAGIWMIDLLSREGTVHNGTPRRVARLNEGDRIRIGLFTIRIQFDFPPSPESPSMEDQAGPFRGGSPNGEHPLARRANGSHLPREEFAPLLPGPLVHSADFSIDGPGVDVVLRPFLENMALMQQEMAEQFHQSLMQMAKMFGSMQRDQLKRVRGELEQIRTLTDEIKALRDELKKIKSVPAPAPTPTPIVPPARPRAAGRDDASSNRRPRSEAGTARSSFGTRGHGPAAPDRQFRRDPKAAQTRIHELLARYESERQSRWSRVIGYLTGKPSST